MLLWISLFGGLGLGVAIGATIFAMRRADRRARRTLLRQLGLDAETIDVLMMRKGDMRSVVSVLRHQRASGARPYREPSGPANRAPPFQK
jgi:hypothetical protein